MHPLRQVHHLFEEAIEAMANEDAFFHRLDVGPRVLAQFQCARSRFLQNRCNRFQQRLHFGRCLDVQAYRVICAIVSFHAPEMVCPIFLVIFRVLF